MVLCPYEAYCPLGISKPPLGGAWTESTAQWAPILDGFNEWVKVDGESFCVKWSSMNVSPGPEWGKVGGENEGSEHTKHIMCCIHATESAPGNFGEEYSSNTSVTATVAAKPGMHDEMSPHSPHTTTTTATVKNTANPTAEPTPPPTLSEAIAMQEAPASALISQTLEATKMKYNAQWFDRDSGWTGVIYSQALEFCAKKGSSIPCPYEAYCPLGKRINFHYISLVFDYQYLSHTLSFSRPRQACCGHDIGFRSACNQLCTYC